MAIERRVAWLVMVATLCSAPVETSKPTALGVCKSKSMAAPFTRRGQPPGPASLSFCDGYKSSTCCDRTHTDAVRAGLYYLSRVAAGGDACVAAWLSAQCSLCHPQSGVADGVPLCTKQCDNLHAACKDAYFALDAATQVLTPCRERDVVCTRLGDWSQSGAQTCELAGFTPVAPEDAVWCFDGREPRSSTSHASRAKGAEPAVGGGSLLQQPKAAWLATAAGGVLYVALVQLRRLNVRGRGNTPADVREMAARAAAQRAHAG